MIRRHCGQISWLEFELFEGCKHLRHGVFLRHGGVSEGPFSSLNVGFDLGDNDENVRCNRRKIAHLLSKKTVPLITGEQVHKNRCGIVNGTGPHTIKGADGLITCKKDIALMVRHADCQAAIFYDPVHKVVAAVHAGWKGSVANIYKEAITALTHSFGAKKEDILVAISPSLGPTSSEFREYKKELPQEFWKYQIKPLYFDFWAISRAQLEEAGILPHHIQFAEIDTYTVGEDFFSYRREKICGRNATIAMLK